MNLNDVEHRILQKIGQPVKFGDQLYSDGKMEGILKDRVIFPTRSISGVKQFIDLIDLIEFTVGDETKEAIRFAYYIVKENGHLQWGSQTTLTEEKSILLELFRTAYRDKPWFKELIDGCRQ